MNTSTSETTFNKLSVVMPCYNEEQTLAVAIERVLSADTSNLSLELVIVDDASSDKSVEIIERLAANDHRIVADQHPVNMGKGAAVRKGFEISTGDIVLIQDADLEYSPDEYPKLLAPILDGRAEAVFGSRFVGGDVHRVLYFWHAVGNRFLTFLSNMFTNLTLTDMETCYKVLTRELLDRIELRENRFGFEPEITAKISKVDPKPRIYEVGIGYSGRTYNEGKKIGWKDGVSAIYCILRYNLFR